MSKLLQLHKLTLTFIGLLISVAAQAEHPALSGGYGTYDSPYLVSTKEDLVALSDFVNEESDGSLFYYVLTADIDMSGIEFEPINNYKYPLDDYKVNFDGNNHKITNLTIAKGNNYCGLFGKISGNHLTIKDLSIENLNIEIEIETGESEVYAGGIVAYYNNPTQSGTSSLINCSVSGKIRMEDYIPGSIGGVAGDCQNIDIQNCKNYADIDVEYGYMNANTTNGTGGIVGSSRVPSITGTTHLITQCSNFGNIKGPKNVGGIAGYTLGISASKNNNTGHITYYDGWAGGIVGNSNSTLIDFSCNIGPVTISFEGVSNKSSLQTKYVGGIAGYSLAARTVLSFYPLADNLNAGFIDGWNYTGGVCGYSNGWTYNNINVAPITDGSQYIQGCKSGANLGSYPLNGSNGKNYNYGGSLYDKQMSLLPDSMNGKEFEGKEQLYELYTYQLLYDSAYQHFVSTIEIQGPHAGEYNWIYNEGVYPVPNNIDPDFNILASAIIKIDSSDRVNDINHQFKIVTIEAEEEPTIESASKNKICQVAGKTIGLVGTGKDTLILSYKGMRRYIPVVVNSVDTMMFSGGTGTADDPYLISSLKDLKELKFLVLNYPHPKYPEKNWSYGRYLKVVNDIDDEFEGNIGVIGNEGKEFQGYLDGNGHRVSVNVEGCESEYAAFISCASAPATIKNLEVNGNINACKKGAGIVGLAKNISIDSCLNMVNVEATDTAGGIVAKAYHSTFSCCGNNGFVKSPKVSGGIVGYTEDCKLDNVVNGGSVVSTITGGGLLGSIVNTTLNTGVNYGYTGRTTQEIDGTNIGYTVAKSKNSSVKNDYWCAQTNTIWDETWQTDGLTMEYMMTSATFKGSLSDAWDTSSDTTLPAPKALSKFKGSKLLTLPYTFTNKWNTLKDINESFSVPGKWFKTNTYTTTLGLGCDKDHFIPKEEGEITPLSFGTDTLYILYYFNGVDKENIKNKYIKKVPLFSSYGFASGGKGTKDDPYRISSEKDFSLLAKTVFDDYLCVDTLRNASWHKYFIQTTDLTEEHTNQIGKNGRERYEWNGFYDGGGHSINLALNSSSNNTGLFTVLSKGATIGNLTTNGTVEGKNNCGAITGKIGIGSSVSNCRNNAAVNGNKNTGGIAGLNEGGSIRVCYNNGAISGTAHVGGICGYAGKESRNSDLANLGQITGGSSIGGITGTADSCDVRRALNAGIVKGSTAVGGIAGTFRWNGETADLIFECMNFGYLAYEGSHIGAIVGENVNSGTNVTLCFYNNQLTLAKAIDGNDNEGFATGLSTVELTGYNLEELGYHLSEEWELKNQHYPTPRALTADEAILICTPAYIAEGETYINIGTEFDVVNENNVEWFGKTGSLTISGNKTNFNRAGTDTLVAKLNGATKQQPVFVMNGLFSGGNGSKERPFLITCKKDMEDLALFVNTNMLEVDKTKNWSDGKYFKLMNDIPEDSVIVTIVGMPEDDADDDYVHFGGYFKGQGYKMKTRISSSAHNVGLFGLIKGGAVDSLTIYGSVSGISNVGGFAGDIENGTISNCNNQAQIYGNDHAGGICGIINNGSIKNCGNSGTVTSKENRAGGIVGKSQNTTIDGCVNIATISAYTLNSYSGGICGCISGNNELKRCLNAGAVNGENRIGGIVGGIEGAANGSISECLEANEINKTGYSSSTNCGYICGQVSSGTTITDCYYDNRLAKLESASDKTAVAGLETEKMTGEQLKGNLKTNWIYSTDKYPRPINDTIALLASSTLLFTGTDHNKDINDEFEAYTYPGCNWRSKDGKVSINIEKATLEAFGKDTMVAYYKQLEKKVAIDIQCITLHNQDTLTGCDSVEYENKFYYEDISFNDTLKSQVSGCDSLVGISIIVKHSTKAPEQPVIYAIGNYVYEGITYTQDTTITTIKTNAAKCDSIIVQKLSIAQTHITRDTITAGCDSTLFNSTWYKKDTILETNYKDEKGRDTLIAYTHINVNYSVTETEEPINSYDSLVYKGQVYLKDTTVTDTTLLETGCTHIIKTPIHIGKTVRKNSNKTYCKEGMLYLSTGKIEVTKDTIVNDTTRFDKDELDITIYNVSIMQPKDTTIYYTNCDTIVFRGKVYNESTVIDTAYATEWCDSTVHYVLNVLKPTIKEQSRENCYVTKYKGFEYTENTVVYDTLKGQNHYGCDSIIKTNIIVNKATTDTLHTYGEESKIVYGHLLTNDTTIVDTLVNKAGCDSLLVTEVHITHLTVDTTSLYGCDSLTIEGVTYKKSTTLLKRSYDPYMKWDDLDQREKTFESHLQYMNIVIGKFQEYTEYIDDCEQITFRGKTYTEDAEIRDSFVSKSGCDSIMVYKLRIHKPQEKGNVNLTGCGIVTWENQSFYSDTTFEHTLLTQWGCDSICIVNINVRHPEEVHIIEEGCNYVEYEGETYEHDTVVTRILTNIGGCDSTVYAHIKVFHPTYSTITYEGEYDVMYKGRKYTRSTVLRDTLTNHWGCDSIIKIAIIVTKSLDYPIIVNKYGYMLLCNNNIGKDRYTNFQWYKDGQPVYGETKAYYSETVGKKLEGCYQVYVTTKDGREYFSEEICIDKEKQLTVYPNPVAKGKEITIDYEFNEIQKKGLYIDVYNSAGKKVYHDAPTTFPIVIPGQKEQGYYFVLITTGEDKNIGAKFIVK